MKLTKADNPQEIEKYSHIKPAPTFGPKRCFAKFPGGRYSCTLEQYHDGPHVAHFFKKVVAVWG